LNVPSEDALFSAILQAVARFSVWLGVDESDANEGDLTKANVENSREWLTAAFAWHRATIADAVNEMPLDLTSLASQHLVAVSSRPIPTDLIVKGIALVILWFEEVDAALLSAHVKTLAHWTGTAGTIARALIELGATREALELLQSAVNDAPEYPLNWLVLARLYAAAQQPAMSIETLQAAIERHQEYAPLLMQYGDALIGYADQN